MDVFVNQVQELFRAQRWREIIEMFHSYKDRNTLLWVFPSEQNLIFLQSELRILGCDEIISIGCGSGLLEWIIEESTEIPVHCIELERSWWQSQYAPQPFKRLNFAAADLDNDDDTIQTLSRKNTAIMFCYFNNGEAFKQYLNYFGGKCLVLIGPGNHSGVHTDPKTFLDDMEYGWRIHAYERVRSSRDYIVIYVK